MTPDAHKALPAEMSAKVLALFDRSDGPVIAGRTQRPPRLITLRARDPSLTSLANGRDLRRWGFKSKPPNTHGCTGVRFR
jgi:hypothetical protein